MSLNRIGVIGAGTMGSGIAQVCASAGLHVTLIDVTESALARGMTAMDEGLQRQVRKARICEGEREATLARVQATTDYASLADADLVIEAATENLDLKLRILRQIEAVVSGHAVIATNTSSISITQLAAVLERPERFIGVHFFNPVPAMQLLELIRGLQTSSQTHAAVEAFAKAVGKTAINVDNAPGFVVNRILIPMINEAVFVLQEGLASARDIDTGMQLGCNHPIGPLALADMIGLDTLLSIMQVLHEGFGDPKYRPARLLKDLVAAGHLGRKSGRGFHSY
ncbi:3-hydroxybutyryl-CoA dehydrogenase [Metapseudomonas resinovorans]|uniref:3-hydroxybutyryl-CoA dehydrogenase n=1 Tax=Metapseudomonas resinovorans TaxID=53412 RepID=UPI000986EE7F|nr:3-hydroxybutyryl-CoA dehydrogenase [Pseudomonas resinovorans]GLZ84338.1 3-hydroxybutyryl-CoA dehydrogenase [Pseudomonas resinovorans]